MPISISNFTYVLKDSQKNALIEPLLLLIDFEKNIIQSIATHSHLVFFITSRMIFSKKNNATTRKPSDCINFVTATGFEPATLRVEI